MRPAHNLTSRTVNSSLDFDFLMDSDTRPTAGTVVAHSREHFTSADTRGGRPSLAFARIGAVTISIAFAAFRASVATRSMNARAAARQSASLAGPGMRNRR